MAVVAGWVGALGVLAAVVTPGAVAAPGSSGAVAAPGAVGTPGRPGVVAASGPVGTPGRSEVVAAPGPVGTAGRPGGLAAPGPVAPGGVAFLRPGVPVGRAGSAVGFVVVSEVDASIGQEMRYATSRNFTGSVVDGYDEPVCLLARPAAEALRRAQREALRGGYSLLVYDCYRPQRAVDRFVRWARDGADQRTKAEFYPEVAKERLIPEGYIAERSGHSRGSTVDVTLTKVGRGPLDMGTAFDFFDPLAHTASPRVTGSAREHREVLGRLLGAQGFVNLPQEWWHFTYAPEAFPATYFDFPVSVASVHR